MGPLEKSEGNKGLQERCVPAAEGSRWEGGETALACYRCQPDDALEGASGLHWCENRRPLQAFNIPLLGFLFFLFRSLYRSRRSLCGDTILAIPGHFSLSDSCSGIRRRKKKE